jgi:hypothetical protein
MKMDKKAIIAVTWPISILFAIWLGIQIGVGIGHSLGEADYHNYHVRELQHDLSDASAVCTDPKMKGAVDAVRKRLSVMGLPEGPGDASRVLEAELRELQNRDNSPDRESAPLLPGR